jgi:hypothetical protein
MKEGEQRSNSGQHRNQLVQLMFKDEERWKLAQLPVAQQDRNVFQTEHQQIARNAERDFGQHGVRIGMPEGKPCAQGLANVDHQDRDRAAVADEANHYGRVENRSQLGPLQDIDKKSSEERTRSQSDNAEIEKDPQAEGEAVIHICLVQPVVKAEAGRIDSHREQG